MRTSSEPIFYHQMNIESKLIKDYIVYNPEKSEKIHNLIKNFGEHTAIAWINAQKKTSKDNTTKRRGGRRKRQRKKRYRTRRFGRRTKRIKYNHSRNKSHRKSKYRRKSKRRRRQRGGQEAKFRYNVKSFLNKSANFEAKKEPKGWF
jgi:hypothetical protein